MLLAAVFTGLAGEHTRAQSSQLLKASWCPLGYAAVLLRLRAELWVVKKWGMLLGGLTVLLQPQSGTRMCCSFLCLSASGPHGAGQPGRTYRQHEQQMGGGAWRAHGIQQQGCGQPAASVCGGCCVAVPTPIDEVRHQSSHALEVRET